MAHSHLRIYYGPEGEAEFHSAEPVDTSGYECGQKVSVPLRDVIETLSDAVQRNRGWLRDFADDEITISTDLYEVILAYQHYHRPSA